MESIDNLSGKCDLQRDFEIVLLRFHGSMIVRFGRFRLRYTLIQYLSLFFVISLSKISVSPETVKLLIVLVVLHRIFSDTHKQQDPCYSQSHSLSIRLDETHLSSPH